MNIEYASNDLGGVNWTQLKSRLQVDEFDNGRTAAQLRESFANSDSTCFAFCDGDIVGTARALSDHVGSAYLLDVWTYGPFRRKGIARTMIDTLLAGLTGQHVYLQTDSPNFYERIGFSPRPTGMEIIVGTFLGADLTPSAASD
jgi:predicted GNAT family acetyltransferase